MMHGQKNINKKWDHSGLNGMTIGIKNGTQI